MDCMPSHIPPSEFKNHINMFKFSRWTVVFSSFLVLSTGLISSSAQAESNIKSLTDGNYRVCSEVASAEGKVPEMCFLFRKVGDSVIGNFFAPNSEVTICITGKVNNNNIISGEALESTFPDEPHQLDSESQGSKLVNWDNNGYLKIAEGSVKNTPFTRGDGNIAYQALINYRNALINLNGFSLYNAGTTLPPRSCKSDT